METLNDMIDMETVQASALNNHVPTSVLAFEIAGAAIALGLLALYLAVVSRGVVLVILAAAFVAMLLFITFDLDRPRRGLVEFQMPRSSASAPRWRCRPQRRARSAPDHQVGDALPTVRGDARAKRGFPDVKQGFLASR